MAIPYYVSLELDLSQLKQRMITLLDVTAEVLRRFLSTLLFMSEGTGVLVQRPLG